MLYRSRTSFLISSETKNSNNNNVRLPLTNSFTGRNINLIHHQTHPAPTASALTQTDNAADISASESGRIDSSDQTIHRRVTLRPAAPFAFPPSYINSFYKYKAIDYSQTSTLRPTFKKTTRESLWSPSSPFYNSTSSLLRLPSTTPTVPLPSSSSSNSNNSNGKTLAAKLLGSKTNSHLTSLISSKPKPTIYVTGTVLRPSNSSVATTVETTISKEQRSPEVYTHLEIVTSKSTHINGEEVTEEPEVPEEINTKASIASNDNTAPTSPTDEDKEKEDEATTLFLTRYGTGSGGSASSEYISTLPSVVFDEEEINNVGAEEVEVEVDEEIQQIPTTTQSAAASPSKETVFFEGNGIRRPDTQQLSNKTPTAASASSLDERTTTIGINNSNSNEKDREASQVHSPATMKMYEFQRNKSPVSWANKDKKTGRSLPLNASSSSSSSNNSGPGQIRLGPRLRFRLKN